MKARTKPSIADNTKTVAAKPAKKPKNLALQKLPTKVAGKLNPLPVPVTPKAVKPALKAAAKPIPAATAQVATSHSKQTQLIASLRTESGMTIEEMMTLTGWQAHSLRGVISGVMRKRLGLNVVSAASASGQSRIYRIVEQACA